MRFYEISESFNTVVPRTIVQATPNKAVIKANIGGRDIVFVSTVARGPRNEVISTVEFYEQATDKDISYKKTGSGSEMQVFSFIIECIKDIIIDQNPDIIDFDVIKGEENRGKLYSKLAAKIPGYSLSKVNSTVTSDTFIFVKDK